MKLRNRSSGYVLDLFWSRCIETESGCWKWRGAKTSHGYGAVKFGKLMEQSHRVSYMLASAAPIPHGLVVRHSCDVPECVNPAHLSLGTYKDNTRDMWDRKRHPMSTQTHCRHGHPYDASNTYRRPNGCRDCRQCIRDRVRLYKVSVATRRVSA